MPRSMLLPVLAISCWAADPAVLHVQVHQGKYLTFNLDNNYTSPVTRFEVAVNFPGTGLSCGLTAEVKRPEDLHPSGTCGLPVSNGKASRPDWRARIVSVEFADGMRWAPKP